MQTQQREKHASPRGEKRRDLFHFMVLSLRTALMVPLRFEAQRPAAATLVRRLCECLELCLEVFLYLVVAHIWVLYVCTVYLNWHKDDLDYLVNCLIQTVIYFWTIVMKVYFRRGQPQRLRRLIDHINLRYQTRSNNGFTYVTMDETIAFSNIVCKIFVYACYLATGTMLVPIANGDRSLPLACWYPFDHKQPWVYESMFVLQAIGQIQVAAAFSTSAGLYMSLAILISGQFDVLFCNLKNIVASAYIAAGAPAAVLRDLQRLQLTADDERRQYYCAKEHTSALHEFSVPAADADNTLSATAEERIVARLQASLREYVAHHRYIMAALREMEAFYSPIWYFKTGEMTLTMCLVTFGSVKTTAENSSLVKALSLYQYLILVVCEMLIICYFGEVILETSQRCGEALLRSPWYLHMHAMRQDFLFFVMNSQRAFRLTAGKIYVLNVERFRAVMAMAFSFLTLLQKMDLRA